MKILDVLTCVYAKMHNYDGIPYWMLTPLRKFIRMISNIVLPYCLENKQNNLHRQSEEEIIVSLTSFPARIESVWQVVECMLKQTLLPTQIILWLSKEQFPTREFIPDSLKKRENDIFKIRLVEGDIRSHKKYYYVACEFPNSYVFLIDDDIYYPSTILERSLIASQSNPDSVICNYAYEMKYQKGELMAYKKWDMIYTSKINYQNVFFGSGGGTLFRPSMLYKDLTNIELASKLTPIADDIWLNAMVKLSKTNVYVQSNGLPLPVQIKNNVCLAKQNVSNSQNDEQLKNIINYYVKFLGINPFAQVSVQK